MILFLFWSWFGMWSRGSRGGGRALVTVVDWNFLAAVVAVALLQTLQITALVVFLFHVHPLR